MKYYISFLAVFAFLLMILPCGALFSYNSKTAEKSEKKETKQFFEIKNINEIEKSDNFIILHTASGQTSELTAEEYVTGAVLAEMPASFHTEALKAQAVACYTYADRIRSKELISPTPELKGAYISDDYEKYQAFFDENAARNFYKDGYDEAYSRVNSAVKAVLGEKIEYNGEPVIAAFHAFSSGKTESALNIWGKEIEYLVPVDSISDKDVADYEQTAEFTPKEVSARLSVLYGCEFDENKPETWFSSPERSSSGTVLSISAGSSELTGMQVREALSLRSAVFDVVFDGEKFVFTTKGYGHGVGMSQRGAEAMAQNGAVYSEILLHYYPGTEICR